MLSSFFPGLAFLHHPHLLQANLSPGLVTLWRGSRLRAPQAIASLPALSLACRYLRPPLPMASFLAPPPLRFGQTASFTLATAAGRAAVSAASRPRRLPLPPARVTPTAAHRGVRRGRRGPPPPDPTARPPSNDVGGGTTTTADAASLPAEDGVSPTADPTVSVPFAPGKVRAHRAARGGSRRRSVYIQGRGWASSEAPPAAPPPMRIFSGSARGRRLVSPAAYLRPMMGKVREALFSMLAEWDALDGGRGSALDLYAGSGAVGCEALSRGAAAAVFVDTSPECVATIEANVGSVGFADRSTVLRAPVEDVLAFPARYGLMSPAAQAAARPGGGVDGGGDPAPRVGVFGFVSVTPPYEEVDYGVLLSQLVDSPLVGEGTFVGVEYPVELGTLPPVISGAGGRLVGVRNRRYGRTLMALYVWGGGEGDDARPNEFRA